MSVSSETEILVILVRSKFISSERNLNLVVRKSDNVKWKKLRKMSDPIFEYNGAEL